MSHSASPAFWECYNQLPDAIRELADKNFALLKDNPNHPSLYFKVTVHETMQHAGLSTEATL